MKIIKEGNKEEEVRELCVLLMRFGYDVGEHFVFTPEIKRAVIAFQQVKGLDADGIVGYRSWEALLFDGRKYKERLIDEDFRLAAKLLGIEVAVLKAVQCVETGGRGGFFAPGKPAILFEGHVFWSQLKKLGVNPEQFAGANANILYPKWEKGHYKGGIHEYERLEQARQINREAADASASWGMFQIMGFNFAACGEKTVADFVHSMMEGECKQLLLFCRFIRQAGMLPALQAKNWVEFAKKYNGPAYAQNRYDEKLVEAYVKSCVLDV